eukprot:COSAG02_NODE_1924_length_10351_cov_4.487320_10_plen_48_part_00
MLESTIKRRSMFIFKFCAVCLDSQKNRGIVTMLVYISAQVANLGLDM